MAVGCQRAFRLKPNGTLEKRSQMHLQVKSAEFERVHYAIAFLIAIPFLGCLIKAKILSEKKLGLFPPTSSQPNATDLRQH